MNAHSPSENEENINWESFQFPLEEECASLSLFKILEKANDVAEVEEEIDWNSFQFPIQENNEKKEFASESEAIAQEEDDGDDEGDSGSAILSPAAPIEPEDIVVSQWEYRVESGFLENQILKKKIDLRNLNDANKIGRLLALCRDNPKMSFDSLVRALEKASWTVFDMELRDLLKCYPSGTVLPWVPTPKNTPKNMM